MKNTVLIFLALVLVIFVFKSCSKDNSPVEQDITSSDIAPIKSAITSGDWHISYFYNTDKEETDNFMGYVFTFNTAGTLGATNGNASLSGAWSIKDSGNSNDDSGSNVDFNVFFAGPDDFKELSEDWEIKKYSNTQVELIHVSGGDGGTDLLTFMKN